MSTAGSPGGWRSGAGRGGLPAALFCRVMMRRIVLLSAGLVLLLAVAFPRPRQAVPRRVLYLTQSVGYKHEVLPLSEKILVEVGKKHGFDVTVSSDASTITAENLKPYSAIL